MGSASHREYGEKIKFSAANIPHPTLDGTKGGDPTLLIGARKTGSFKGWSTRRKGNYARNERAMIAEKVRGHLSPRRDVYAYI